MTPEEQETADKVQAMTTRAISMGAGCFAVLLCGSVPCGGAFAIGLALFGSADISIHHDGREAIEVWVDGAKHSVVVEPGVSVVELERGDHHIALHSSEGVQDFELPTMTGLDDILIPTNPSTCFVVLNVSYALYGSSGPFSDPEGDVCDLDPDDVDWISTITDFPAWEANNPYSSEDLPASIDLGTPVFLTLPVPCAELETVDVTGVLLDHLAC
jgi:hypothetical protein